MVKKKKLHEWDPEDSLWSLSSEADSELGCARVDSEGVLGKEGDEKRE
jgi:hypothetical protein